MIRIVEPVDGAILNRNDGKLTPGGLEITVKGTISSEYAKVWVNDAQAEVSSKEFTCRAILQERENRIVAFARGELDERAASVITVLWDRNSVKRYRFSVDNVITALKDVALNVHTYNSVFENRFLGFWKEMNERYGTKVHFNVYYQTAGFDLTQMPEKYKSEWQENADWLRLSFHAFSDKPDAPYKNATYEEIKRDLLLVTREIERFAGKQVLSTFTTVHWAETPVEACVALRNCGIEGLVGYFTFRDGRPWVSYYLDEEKTRYLGNYDYWKDMSTGIVFVRHDLVLDSLKLDEVGPRLDEVAQNPHQSEIMELMVHEHTAYQQPEFEEKIATAIRWVTDRGYRPVFYDEGFVGA